jgi:xanthine dehydrogenase YagS FAD-binding subunit
MVVAGATGLVDLMKLEVETPDRLLDIGRLPLDGIEDHGHGLRLGALASNSDVARHPAVRAEFPVLSQALLAGASPQLRNAATVGGNLMQRTRCTYFRDRAFACNKRTPGSGCSAQHGPHRMHAVLGVSEQCMATHPSDMCVALLALDAEVEVTGPHGRREIPLAHFHCLPGDTPHIETVLARGEIVTAVIVPRTPLAARSAYLKVRDRASYEFALVSVAVAMELRGDRTIDAIRIALGGVGTRPWRAEATEALLVGHAATPDNFRASVGASLQAAHPRRDNAFKVELVQRAMVRALETVGGLP